MLLHESNLIRSICKQSFYDFLKEFWGTIIHEDPVLNWHVKYLCDELQFVAERVFLGLPKLYDLVINVSPGSTKSTICSQMFPAWVWTRMTRAQLIHLSYAYMIAQKDSIKTRDIVQSDKYRDCFPEVRLREDENTKGLFQNTQGGYRLAAGMGGGITGQHGHFLMVDDPINPEEAASETELRNSNRWMQSTLPTRKVDKEVTVTILIQQRLAQADPSGEMLEKSQGPNGNKIKHICLPGELTEDTNLSPPELRSMYVDGLFDPIRLPRSALQALLVDLGEYGYASQILQQPVPTGGALFKVDMLHLEDVAPKFVRMCRSWDKAGTEDGGMWSVGVLMGVTEKNQFWVVDVVRGQWGATRREAMILQTARLDGPNIPIIVEIEGGSGGKESGENTVRMLAGFRVEAYHPTGDKVSRAYPFASQMGAGNVYVLRRAWTRDYIEEHRYFPHSKYKDQIDAGSGAFNKIARKKIVVGGW